MKVTEIAFTGYPITNLPRARKFYEEVLGLSPSWVNGTDEQGWVEYQIGSSVLAITNMAQEWTPSANGPSAALEMEDFGQTMQELRANGTTMLIEPFETPVCHMAVIADPDGNSLIIHKRKS
ncbi:MAG: VOC family protein [Nitrospirales bacterium]|nr:VOC family protein [Nitrospira sp.]MDR4500058.1 VOC family protein [Nitrospirales bacterium]